MERARSMENVSVFGAEAEDKRQRQLTERGREHLKDKISAYVQKLSRISERIDIEILNFNICTDISTMQNLSDKVRILYNEYQELLRDLIELLDRNPGDISDCEKSTLQTSEAAVRSKVFTVMSQIDKVLKTLKSTEHNVNSQTVRSENVSETVRSEKKSQTVRSENSTKSGFSSTSVASSITRQKAKMEAARVKYEFAFKASNFKKKQAEIERTKNELKAEQELLECERDFAVAEAEYEVYIQGEIDNESERSSSSASLRRVREERTKSYVTENVGCQQTETFTDTAQPLQKTEVTSIPEISTAITNEGPHVKEQHETIRTTIPTVRSQNALSPATVIETRPNDAQCQKETNFVEEFSKYLIRKELLMTRFINFNDQAESFSVWKESFTALISELGVGAREQLDLLVKFLGPKSSEQAKSLRNANASNPDLAISKIWARLEERYGRPELIDASFKTKLERFPKIVNQKDFPRLYELLDTLNEIESMKEDERYRALLSQYDTSVGVNKVLVKLPYNVQQKWFDRASKYKNLKHVPYPPFNEFVSFIREVCTRCNDPGFSIGLPVYESDKRQAPWKKTVSAYKTDVKQSQSNGPSFCPLHGAGHQLNACRTFRQKTIDERKGILKDNKLCYRCCETSAHTFRDCKTDVKCKECNSANHPTAMHVNRPFQTHGVRSYGGERQVQKQSVEPQTGSAAISTKCTQLCGDRVAGRSCAKTILVKVFPKGKPEHGVMTYAVHDDQSNKTLGSSVLFDSLCIKGETRQYSLSSCAGITKIRARHASNLIVQSVDGSRELTLPDLIECELPNERSEIPTPEVAKQFVHLASLVDSIPNEDPAAEIGLLVGRDVVEAHHVEQQIIGPRKAPFAQKLPLGWVIIGEVCLGQFHKLDSINAFKTHFTKGERPSVFSPCNKSFQVKEDFFQQYKGDVFQTSKCDERVGMSQDDFEFVAIMEEKMIKDPGGKLKAPLPFRKPRIRLPNNRPVALKRACAFESSLKKNVTKQQHMLDFMEQIFESGAAEVAPALSPEKECWYLPLFGVYHPRKPEKIRGVFDSSVEYEGRSLNNELLTGPNLTNSLLGVLLRFRRDCVAVVSDIEQMFYSFLVSEEYRDYLRFFWFRNNDPRDNLIEYRMRVHVFGNTPSPAVATFGLRRSVTNADEDVKRFVERDFYVDDGLTSCTSVANAISLLQRTQKVLCENAKIRLHKIASNVPEVMDAFLPEDLEKNLRTIDIFSDDLPTQASLGLVWDLNRDAFSFSLIIPETPDTRRGVLSAINSIFDPLGFLAPITVGGRMLLREITACDFEWDQPLPEDLKNRWETWKQSLETVKNLHFPRMFMQKSWSQVDTLNIFVFADASEKAISAVAYVRATFQSNIQVGFLMGKSKLSPPGGTTIPRLELCAALLPIEMADVIMEHLDVSAKDFIYHSDSKVVLGYLNNRTRRFYTYVTNRVQAILKTSKASQWRYVASQNNPADCGTRCNTPAEEFQHSIWVIGPPFMKDESVPKDPEKSLTFNLVDETEDRELRPEIQVKITKIARSIASRFEKFSTWKSLVSAFSFLQRFCRAYKKKTPISESNVLDSEDTKNFLIQTAQKDAFGNEMNILKKNAAIPSSSSIALLSPVMDELNILRVGGRINKFPTSYGQRHPIIISGKSHLARLLVTHYHSKNQHQGRLVTESAIRTSGIWITGAKRLVSSVLHKCVTCRKLRGKFHTQRMADLPADRVTPGAPFTAVGIDAFGPWSVVTRKTRGGCAESKRWAILFTCLATRATHIEVVEDMSSSAFINALRRFVALRGPVKEFRSDRGSNFVGALDHIQAVGVCVEKGPVHDHLKSTQTIWTFNPPHSSHMGGAWERLIGIARRILDAMLLTSHSQKLTHEVLCTFMSEVSAIMNSRPIAPISYDPENPEIITPAMLLTQKKEPLPALSTSVDIKDIYKSQWKYVQCLSNTFWRRWRDGYLQSLQMRRKWLTQQPDVKTGDIVMLRDKELHRNNWPMAVIEKVFPSDCDGKIRTVEIRVVKGGKTVNYVRPVAELIPLVDSV